MKKVLIIEDEAKISRFLQLELKHEGYDTQIAEEGRKGYAMAQTGEFDIIILDLMLPNLSGIEICRRLRSEGIQTPIIMLTAKDDVSDKVTGLDVGANDYMTKPFAIEELLARMRVALKNNDRTNNATVIRCGKLTLNREKYEVKYDDTPITLTKKEFELLSYLMLNKNIVLSREQIVENVWGYEYEAETNVTDVYIRYLRSKIDEVFNTSFIKTVRGVGYQFRDEEEE
ncbi:MAG: response regulator transcription factor [Eubacteriaceae bacterium]|nr:response regulator transcription factor [Eubacteriaceae bacterium]MBR2780295.1 response regulator transcription factor [Eubacteriaceae bacterium]MCR4894707.1 response regulator transcription factor [Eubacteriales bacterium]